MRPIGGSAGDKQAESIDFVPKRDLDQAQQETSIYAKRTGDSYVKRSG